MICSGKFDTTDMNKSFCFHLLVISRNILTDPSSSSQPAADELDSPVVRSESSSPPSDPRQSGAPEGAAVPRESAENPKSTGAEGTTRDGGRTGNSSVLVAGGDGAPALNPGSVARKRSHDRGKSAHADEM